MKSIIFALVLSSLLSLYNVEVTARFPAPLPKVDPTVKHLCSSTEFPGECVSSVTPYISGTVDVNSVLQAGLKCLTDRAYKAKQEVAKMQKEIKSALMAKQVGQPIIRYEIMLISSKRAAQEIYAKDYVKVKDSLIASVNATNELVFNVHQSPQADLNNSLRMVAKNNLDILMNVVKPSSPPEPSQDQYKEEEGH